jgi:hypothetical protein
MDEEIRRKIRTHRSRHLLIALSSRPSRYPLRGHELARYQTVFWQDAKAKQR